MPEAGAAGEGEAAPGEVGADGVVESCESAEGGGVRAEGELAIGHGRSG